MQRAETADSTRTRFASPGMTAQISRAKIVMEVADISAVHLPMDEVGEHLDKCALLLTMVSEVAQEAAADSGFWYREVGYEQRRLRQIDGMVGLLQDEIGRMQRLVGALA